MLKTKSIFTTTFEKANNKHSLSYVKKSLAKKIGSGILLAALAIFASETATYNSNANKMDALVSYKINYYANLSDYNTLKTQINNFNYTDSDFNKDLTTFKYLYTTEGNNVYQQMVNHNSLAYASRFASLIAIQHKYIDVNKKYQELLSQSKNIKMKNGEDINSYSYLLSSNIEDKANSIQFKKYISTAFKIGNNYTGYGTGLSLDKPIYDNMSALLKEKGYNENILFLPYDFLSSKAKYYEQDKSKEFIRIENDYKKNSDDYMLSLYKSGDMNKLRELFRMSRAFNYIITEKPLNDNKNNIDLQFSALNVALYSINSNFYYDTYEQLVSFQKLKGNLTPEKKAYYDNPLSFYY